MPLFAYDFLCVQVCVHAYMRAFVCAIVRVCVRLYVCACNCMCVRACVRTYVCIDQPIHLSCRDVSDAENISEFDSCTVLEVSCFFLWEKNLNPLFSCFVVHVVVC